MFLTKVPVHVFAVVVTVEPQYLFSVVGGGGEEPPVTTIFVLFHNVFVPAFAVILILPKSDVAFFSSSLAVPVEVLK